MKAASQKKSLDMLHGPLWDKIPRFAIPVAATAILSQLFNAADIAVIGNFTGELRTVAVAAVGTNSSIISLIVNLFIGIALGANVTIAHAIGEKNDTMVHHAVHTSIVVAVLGGLIAAIIGELFAVPLLNQLNVPDDVFPLALLYHELLLRAFDPASVFFDGALLPIALAAIGGGLLLSLLCGLLPWRKTVRWVSLCLTLLWSVFVCVQYCCKSYFKTYFALTFMVTMTGHVVGGFAATILEIILPRLPFILLAMLPLVLASVLRRRIVPEARTGRTVLLVMAGLSVLTIGGSAVLFRLGPNAALYTYDFNTDSAVSKFGPDRHPRAAAVPSAPAGGAGGGRHAGAGGLRLQHAGH